MFCETLIQFHLWQDQRHLQENNGNSQIQQFIHFYLIKLYINIKIKHY